MSTSKKILYIITKSNFGGAQRYVYELATSLPSDQFEVVVAFGGHGKLAELLEAAHIRTIVIPQLLRDINIMADIRSLLALIRIYRREQPDVVHLNSSKIGVLGAIAGWITRMPKIIFTAHGWVFNEDRPPIVRWASKIIHWIGILLCHKVITINGRETDQVKNWPWVAQKLTKIYNGIGTVKFKDRQTARQDLIIKCPELSPKVDELWIGTIAELHTNKGLDILLEAIHDIEVSHLGFSTIIIGEGEERKNLERIRDNHNLGNTVFLLGTIEEARNYLKAFDIFVLPSRKEGVPYAILEAGAAGLPIVASRVGGIPEIIESGETGLLIASKDQKALGENLTRLLENVDLRHRLALNLQRKISTDFSLQRMITETKALY